MKYSDQLEVILFSKYSLKDPHQKELIKWLRTTAQSIIGREHKNVKRIILPALKETPPIYMS